ncbi:aminodeoxychorismate/anthranilate synthase component II [Fulvivirga maritima]|uniref:anthranilate synthase component II n=1 Tax=Fulvivirga maritima TaxID=2904247 RepID=UPI001F3741A6|nr:aminodeoxychorismate/anthranilate synthase component II [Fulvivirga maritima]UII27875.1 aminodeoxychorismate/anthranilate synthase component II [Fulvivirga maritima]
MKEILLLDNFDSFTYNLVDYFSQLGIKSIVFRNDVPLDLITARRYDGVVLSPGPETPGKAGNLMEVVEYYHQKLPMLGICLGHQAIGEFFGGKLIKAQAPMHGKISEIEHSGDILFKNLPKKINVVRYNSLLVEQSPEYEVIATTEKGENMALKHLNLPLWGVQFHPEAALTQYGLEMLKNWASYNDKAV